METSESMAWFVPILIFLARICDVSLGTTRTMVLISGQRILAAVLGFFEVIVWVLAVGGALAYLDHPLAVIGYAGGFACGVLVGMWLEERIALGFRIVRVISPREDADLSAALRAAGFRVTCVEGSGRSGPVEIAFLVIRRSTLRQLRKEIARVDPDAFVTIERVEHATGGGFSDSRFSRSILERWIPVRK